MISGLHRLPYFWEENEKATKFFAVVDVEAAILPSNIYSDFKSLPADGFYVETDMSKNQMLVKEDIAKTDDVMDKYGKEWLCYICDWR